MTKTILKQNIINIFDMNERELNDYGVKVSVSNVDDKARKFLYRAIDKRREELGRGIDPLVVSSDIDGTGG